MNNTTPLGSLASALHSAQTMEENRVRNEAEGTAEPAPKVRIVKFGTISDLLKAAGGTTSNKPTPASNVVEKPTAPEPTKGYVPPKNFISYTLSSCFDQRARELLLRKLCNQLVSNCSWNLELAISEAARQALPAGEVPTIDLRNEQDYAARRERQVTGDTVITEMLPDGTEREVPADLVEYQTAEERAAQAQGREVRDTDYVGMAQRYMALAVAIFSYLEDQRPRELQRPLHTLLIGEISSGFVSVNSSVDSRVTRQLERGTSISKEEIDEKTATFKGSREVFTQQRAAEARRFAEATKQRKHDILATARLLIVEARLGEEEWNDVAGTMEDRWEALKSTEQVDMVGRTERTLAADIEENSPNRGNLRNRLMIERRPQEIATLTDQLYCTDFVLANIAAWNEKHNQADEQLVKSAKDYAARAAAIRAKLG